jgi:hypothetical protein
VLALLLAALKEVRGPEVFHCDRSALSLTIVKRLR